jgi:hypothetical protein
VPTTFAKGVAHAYTTTLGTLSIAIAIAFTVTSP